MDDQQTIALRKIRNLQTIGSVAVIPRNKQSTSKKNIVDNTGETFTISTTSDSGDDSCEDNDTTTQITQQIESSEDANTGATKNNCYICDEVINTNELQNLLVGMQTSTTGTAFLKKMAELLGERFDIIVSRGDVVCGNCENLINDMDRLETDLNNTRCLLLDFLHTKYHLSNGTGNLASPTVKMQELNSDAVASAMDQVASVGATQEQEQLMFTPTHQQITTAKNELTTQKPLQEAIDEIVSDSMEISAAYTNGSAFTSNVGFFSSLSTTATNPHNGGNDIKAINSMEIFTASESSQMNANEQMIDCQQQPQSDHSIGIYYTSDLEMDIQNIFDTLLSDEHMTAASSTAVSAAVSDVFVGTSNRNNSNISDCSAPANKCAANVAYKQLVEDTVGEQGQIANELDETTIQARANNTPMKLMFNESSQLMQSGDADQFFFLDP